MCPLLEGKDGTERFYGMFGYSTLLSYQHWVTSSQQGAHSAKLILQIDVVGYPTFEN